ncbi:MAG: LysM peptidoglycan-binding domain-containing protein [Sedimentisphaerales bacterium]|nr:LysM peptidoglycan-binding domain-containing protein [Sedimentisphaerales bacterium]
MTSDAKVGLLLGLFFIFVIAFIINGLPRFRSETNGNELTTMANSPNDTYIGSNERKAQASFRQERPVQTRAVNTTEAEESTTDAGTVRYKRPLSQDTTVIQDTTIVQEEPVTVAMTQEKVKPTTPTPEPETKKETKINTPEPVKLNLPKVYIVKDGDNLAKIAKIFYGEETGNKAINVSRIFEANRKLLKSPDDIEIGQKLIIPLLKDEAGGIFSSGLFERIKSIGNTRSSNTTSTKTPPSPQPEPSKANNTKYYVVQEGDSLWKIADKQLGNKERFREIIRLNSLDDEDYLKPGQRLMIPAR